MTYLDSTPDMDTKLELIDTLRTVTDGKVRMQQWDWAIRKKNMKLSSDVFDRSMLKLNVHVLRVF